MATGRPPPLYERATASFARRRDRSHGGRETPTLTTPRAADMPVDTTDSPVARGTWALDESRSPGQKKWSVWGAHALCCAATPFVVQSGM